MSNSHRGEISLTDIEDFLAQSSSFSLEMRALKRLTDLGLESEHGGTYPDPITSVSREFDLRAHRQIGSVRFQLSVECKAISEASPLLVHRRPRRREEAYVSVMYRRPNDLKAQTHRLDGDSGGMYRAGEPVGKQTDQVSRKKSGSEFVQSDGDFYSRQLQAVNSCQSPLVAAAEGMRDVRVVALPVVLIPNDRLWSVDYTWEGQLTGPPAQVDRVSYFLGRAWPIGGKFVGDYHISHLEIVTEAGLPGLVGDLNRVEPHIQALRLY